jgi:hypothetical protein
VIAFVVMLVAAAPVAPASRPFGVLVLAQNRNVVEVFDTAKCNRAHGDFNATASETQGRDTLRVYIQDFNFKGYVTYPIKLSDAAVVQVNVGIREPTAGLGPGPHYYSNLNVPPFPSPGGGQLRFTQKGALMGVGFSPMYSRNFADAVTVTGVLRCTYPKKKPSG